MFHPSENCVMTVNSTMATLVGPRTNQSQSSYHRFTTPHWTFFDKQTTVKVPLLYCCWVNEMMFCVEHEYPHHVLLPSLLSQYYAVQNCPSPLCHPVHMPPEKYFLKTLCLLCTVWLVLGYSFDKLSILNLILVAVFNYIHLLQIDFFSKNRSLLTLMVNFSMVLKFHLYLTKRQKLLGRLSLSTVTNSPTAGTKTLSLFLKLNEYLHRGSCSVFVY